MDLVIGGQEQPFQEKEEASGFVHKTEEVAC